MKNSLLILLAVFLPCFALEDILQFSQEPLSRTSIRSGDTVSVIFNIAIKKDWHVWSHQLNDEFLVPTVLTVLNPINVEVFDIVYPEGTKKSLMGMEEYLLDGDNRIIARLKVLGPGRSGFDVALKYQGCNDKMCLPPAEKKVSVSWDVSGSAGSGVQDRLGRYGLFAALLFLFLAGLGLNLTPCVYPVIPITLSFFASQAAQSRTRSGILAALYVLGIAFTYSILGTFAALSGKIMGALLQNPVVLWGIVGVFILLALSMFGLYEIRPPSFLMQKGVGRRGYFGSFAMGLIVGIVVAPCVGPVTAGLLIYVAEKKDPFLGFLYFFMLSLGLGVPYFFLGLFSGSVKRLPGSGGWMIWVRKFFGFALLGMALYYTRTLLPSSVIQWLMFPLLVFAAVYLGVLEKSAGQHFPMFRIFQRIFAIGLILGTILYFKGLPPLGAIKTGERHHSTLTPALYATAVKSGQPFIVDFRAEWCAPCRVFEKTVLTDSIVRSELAGVAFYTVDLTDEKDRDAKEMTRTLHIVGVPTIIFYSSDGTEILRETRLLEVGEFLQAIQRIKGVKDNE